MGPKGRSAEVVLASERELGIRRDEEAREAREDGDVGGGVVEVEVVQMEWGGLVDNSVKVRGGVMIRRHLWLWESVWQRCQKRKDEKMAVKRGRRE